MPCPSRKHPPRATNFCGIDLSAALELGAEGVPMATSLYPPTPEHKALVSLIWRLENMDYLNLCLLSL